MRIQLSFTTEGGDIIHNIIGADTASIPLLGDCIAITPTGTKDGEPFSPKVWRIVGRMFIYGEQGGDLRHIAFSVAPY